MRSKVVWIVLLLPALIQCGGEEGNVRDELPEGPVSIRGWVTRVDGVPNYGQDGNLYDLNAYVEGIERVSGGIRDNGTFVILGVPPGSSTIVFQAPGVEDAAIHFEGLPPRADVLIPGVVLTPGGAAISEPEQAKVRIPRGRAGEVEQIESTTTANGVTLPTYLVPTRELGDRLNHPKPPPRGNLVTMPLQ